jgi:hypothetical protein
LNLALYINKRKKGEKRLIDGRKLTPDPVRRARLAIISDLFAGTQVKSQAGQKGNDARNLRDYLQRLSPCRCARNCSRKAVAGGEARRLLAKITSSLIAPGILNECNSPDSSTDPGYNLALANKNEG